jgi:hypothetical protein
MEERFARAWALSTTYGYSARTIEFHRCSPTKTAVTHGIERALISECIPSLLPSLLHFLHFRRGESHKFQILLSVGEPMPFCCCCYYLNTDNGLMRWQLAGCRGDNGECCRAAIDSRSDVVVVIRSLILVLLLSCCRAILLVLLLCCGRWTACGCIR